MPTLGVGHARYWRGSGGPPPPPIVSGRGGYPAWQSVVIAFSFLLLLLMGH